MSNPLKSNPVRKKRKVLFELQDGCCMFCGRQCLNYCSESDPMQFTVEHIVPRVYGGTDVMQNLVGCCFTCNQQRGQEILLSLLPKEEWLQQRLQERKHINDNRTLPTQYAKYEVHVTRYFCDAYIDGRWRVLSLAADHLNEGGAPTLLQAQLHPNRASAMIFYQDEVRFNLSMQTLHL